MFAICFLALFPRRNHLHEIYSTIDILIHTFNAIIYIYHNYVCEMHIKCIEYNELFLYALRESFIIHITYAFFYTISITFWENPLSLNFFLSFISLIQFNSQNCDLTYLCWTMLQCFKKMYVRLHISVYKHWVILVTFGNDILLKISFLIIPLFMSTRLLWKKLLFERIWIFLKF